MELSENPTINCNFLHFYKMYRTKLLLHEKSYRPLGRILALKIAITVRVNVNSMKKGNSRISQKAKKPIT